MYVCNGREGEEEDGGAGMKGRGRGLASSERAAGCLTPALAVEALFGND